MKHTVLIIHGKVQGVYFRAATKAVANQLGVQGIVKNLPDGTVYIEAEGNDFQLENLVEWCHEGPEKAVVEKVEQKPGELKNYRNFEIVKK
ncbi:acylphosphatase [Olivibacter sp. SDN3]|uniref:acylphosphatase n=1 Tax=Olivibacter sp. SDN3 TaxID=2764720 RepID=UPI0016511F87|nr:acylphosphatase [Olivibacter sp. SDN3]QNL50887.1 acylphosphatase [Olivibacter sp. SDN3]